MVQGSFAPLPGRLRVKVQSDQVQLPAQAWRWLEINANRIHASGNVLIFSLDEMAEGPVQAAPMGGFVRSQTINSRLVMAAQAIDGVLVPLVEAVEAEETSVLSLPR